MLQEKRKTRKDKIQFQRSHDMLQKIMLRAHIDHQLETHETHRLRRSCRSANESLLASYQSERSKLSEEADENSKNCERGKRWCLVLISFSLASD